MTRRPAILGDIAMNVALPFGVYLLLRRAGETEARALVISAVVPAGVAIGSLIRRRRINVLSILVLVATALSLAATAMTGSAWFSLIRPSFVTGLIAAIFAGSLAMEKPALFYLARDTTCPTQAEARAFEAQWVRPGFRRAMRRLTLVWALFLGAEASLRIGLAMAWPNPNLMAATQILWILLPILLVQWSIRAGRRWGAAAQDGQGAALNPSCKARWRMHDEVLTPGHDATTALALRLPGTRAE